MTLKDIKKAVAAKLKGKYPTHKLYDEEIEKGFARPCFFIQLVPIFTNNLGQFYDKKRITVKVHYFSPNKTNEENNTMSDELNNLFRLYMPVLDRNLHILSTDSTTVDSVLIFSFDLDFIDAIEDDGQGAYQFMQELVMKENI